MIRKLRNGHLSPSMDAEMRGQLADILTHRDQGLLSQNEYEEKLQEIAFLLPERGILMEHELPRGGTRFVLREVRSGRVLAQFRFQGAREA